MRKSITIDQYTASWDSVVRNPTCATERSNWHLVVK